jgi:hypothetical protein
VAQQQYAPAAPAQQAYAPAPQQYAPAQQQAYAPAPRPQAPAAYDDEEGYEEEYEETEEEGIEEGSEEESPAAPEPQAQEEEVSEEEPAEEEASEEEVSEEMGWYARRTCGAQMFGARNTHPLACAEFGAPALPGQLDFKKMLAEAAKKAGGAAAGVVAGNVLKDPRVQGVIKQQALDQADAQVAVQVRQTREGATAFLTSYGKYLGIVGILGVAYLVYTKSKKKGVNV